MSGLASELSTDEFAKLREILGADAAIEIKTEVKKITCSAVDKSKLKDEEKAIFESDKFTYDTDGYAVLGNRYVISCDKSFGQAGDIVTFIRKDGTSVNCVIGHVTDDEASKNTVNFYVDPLKWKASNKNNVTVDLVKDISKVVNEGKFSSKTDAVSALNDSVNANTNSIVKDNGAKATTDANSNSTTNTTSDTNSSTNTNSSSTTNTGSSSTTNTDSTTTTDANSSKAVNPLKATIDQAREILNNKNNSDTTNSSSEGNN